MLFDPSMKKLFIVAGQKEYYLSDMWEYDVRSNTLTELFGNINSAGGPEASFAQRAVIDPTLKEIYTSVALILDVLHCAHFISIGGLSKNHRRGAGISLYLYRYDSTPGTWTKITTEEAPTSAYEAAPVSPQGEMDVEGDASNTSKEEELLEPPARGACQVVYDAKSQTFYVHGGNAGQKSNEATTGPKREERLDDFWSMTLERPADDEIIRRARFEIRRQQYV